MNDKLVLAVDDLRYSRNDNLYSIVGAMIAFKGIKQPDSINEVRGCAFESIAELIYRGTSSLEIAKQLHVVVARRVADHFRRARRALSLVGSRVVPLEDVGDDDEALRDPVGVEDIVLAGEQVHSVQKALEAMRVSTSERDRRDCVVLEAFLDEVPVRERMKAVFDKDITDTYAATLLYRAKQSLKSRLETVGLGGDTL